jgi:hypothetical protein
LWRLSRIAYHGNVRTFLASIIFLTACGEVKGPAVDAPPPGEDAAIDSMVIDAPDIDAAIDAALAPEVTTVTVPAGGVDAEGAKATVMVNVRGEANEVLSVTLTSTRGTYAPATATVPLDANGDGVMTTEFTSGNTAGTEMGTAVARNTQNVESPATSFQFPVVALRRIGHPTAYTTQGGFTANNLLGQAVAIPVAGRLKKFGWITATNTEMIKIGIYTNVGGAPGTLVAQMPARTPTVGVNEVVLANPVALAAGTYWFMANYSSVGGTYKDASTNITTKFVALTFANALPTTFPTTHMTYTSNNFNYYVVLGM